VCRFEQRLPVELREVPDIQLDIDSDQIEQALINLVKNAVEAAQSTAGGVRVRVEASATQVAILVEDEGTGLAKTDNLFVPFFTTKPGGSGVGLVLARQIVENHGGSLDLSNRQDTRGAIATVLLPVRGQE
jgi:signal transduction histidine kinase